MKLLLSKELTALVSPEDFEWASQWKWSATNCARWPYTKYYAVRHPTVKGKRIKFYLHREVFIRAFGDIPPGMVVDHYPDSNGLNCRRDNLVLTTVEHNSRRAGKARWEKKEEPWL